MATKKRSTPRPTGARGGRTGTVTEGGAQAALRRGPARELSPDEEKVMRMRLGASPPRTAPLERAGEGWPDVEIEIQALELETYMKWRARRAEGGRAAAPSPLPSRTKEKIVRALRKKS